MKHRFTLLILIFMAFTLQCQQNKGNLTQKTIEIPEGMEVAYFASGCFWCVEGVYEEVYGVNEVISGYAGGTVPNPSYYDHGNHAETVAVIYDASKVSYSVLLQVYFDITNPYTIGQAPDFGKSYRSIVFPKNKSQMEELNTYLASFDRHKIEILLAKSPPFTIAEEYHQDYVSRLLKGENVVNKSYGYNVSLPRRQEFINNTKVRLKD
tara:strand:- start:552 stop:1178 length:627 start_codon:yes stop_codon:yes gene_type:complete